MSKEEFLQILREALAGEVPEGLIQENVQYYDQYITAEMRKGRTAQNIIEELGGPRIIAKTIIDASEAAGQTFERRGPEGDVYGGGSAEYSESRRETHSDNTFHVYNLNKWYWKLAGALILILVVMLVIAVVGGVFSLLLSPIGLILIIVWLLWRNRR